MPFPAHPDADAAVERALAGVRDRAAPLGGAFPDLAGALSRAAQGGKRFRPALVCAAFDAFGGEADRRPGLVRVAAAFELLHAAFVVHDDVIDHDTVRRGIPNVGGEFRLRAAARGVDAAAAAVLGDAAAILAGDLLLHEAGREIVRADLDPDLRERVLDIFDEAVYVSAAGELADVENSVGGEWAATDELLTTAFQKTAVYSFSAPLRAGAVIAGASIEALALLDHAAGRLGVAFQLVDDLIGAFGTEEQAGREAGVDLRESKRTPLVALARQTDLQPHVDSALALAPTGPIAVREAQRVLEKSGARARLRTLIDDDLRRARDIADDPALPVAAGGILRAIADAVEGRIP
ncbi:polyprenyl synthetase family protein [Microbacterium hominis]|uniref:Polyprenyl synthetase family protein n=1 Tax=Microbacterium hominis TaxID=162426 RepID=A0A7D4TG93_9MICO|nr:polyprenyl synthetase family protein [Microbacterium hominis]QKJ19141.1 polyprenyl synthetase family protein [Microbacterium hominis]